MDTGSLNMQKARARQKTSARRITQLKLVAACKDTYLFSILCFAQFLKGFDIRYGYKMYKLIFFKF